MRDGDGADFLAVDASVGRNEREPRTAQEEGRRVTPLVLLLGGRKVGRVETARERRLRDIVVVIDAQSGTRVEVDEVDLGARVVRETSGAAGGQAAIDMEGGGRQVAVEFQEILGAPGFAVTEDRGRAGPGLVAVEADVAHAVAQGEAALELGDADLQRGGTRQGAGGRDGEGRGVGTEEAVDAVGARAECRGGVEGRRGSRESPLAVADQGLVEHGREAAVVHLQRQRADAGGAKAVGGRRGVGAELDGTDGGREGAVELDRRAFGRQDVRRRVEADGRSAVDHDVAGAGVGGGQRDEVRAFEASVVGAAGTEEDQTIGGDQAAVPVAIVGADREVRAAALFQAVGADDRTSEDEIVVRLDTGEISQGGDAVEPRDEGVIVVRQEALEPEGQRAEGQELIRTAALVTDGVQDGISTNSDDVIAERDALLIARTVAVAAHREGAATQEDVGRTRQRGSETERADPTLVAGDDG